MPNPSLDGLETPAGSPPASSQAITHKSYTWMKRNWTIHLHPPGDVVCDHFKPPDALAILPWLLADRASTFLDVGAHVGTVAMHAAPFFKQVVAFEPEPRNLACLNLNVSVNKLPNVTVVPKAVSDKDGTATFYVANSVETGSNSLYPLQSGKFTVETVTLDRLFSGELRSLPPIGYIKMDVEGFEPQVIKGAARTIAQQPVKPVMLVEFTPAKWARNEADFHWLMGFLRENRYAIHLPTSGFYSPVSFEVFGQLFEAWKVLKYDCWLDILLYRDDLPANQWLPTALTKAVRIVKAFR